MKVKICSLLFLFLYSCVWTQELFGQNLLLKDFTKADIKQLAKMIKAFDQQIINRFGGQNAEEAHFKFFDSLSTSKQPLTVAKGLITPIEHQKIIRRVRENTLKKIWSIRTDDLGKVRIQGINLNGNYISYLVKLSEKKPFLKEYLASIRKMGDIDPLCFRLFIEKQNEFLVNDIDYRIVLVVHYLSIRH